MEIKTHYIDFKTAKWLKEKGFDVPTLYCYLGDSSLQYSSGDENDNELYNHNKWDNYSTPEQWQVVEWLRVVHGIWVEVGVGNLFHKDKFYILIKKYNIDRWDLTSLDNKTHSPYDIPQEAYSAAFDYILTNLI